MRALSAISRIASILPRIAAGIFTKISKPGAFIILFFFIAGNACKAQNLNNVPLNNAYDLAIAMAAHKNDLRDTTARTDTFRKKIVGQLIWYANIQDENPAEQIYWLLDKTKAYPALYKVVDTLFRTDFINANDIIGQHLKDSLYTEYIPGPIKSDLNKMIGSINKLSEKRKSDQALFKRLKDSLIISKDSLDTLRTQMSKYDQALTTKTADSLNPQPHLLSELNKARTSLEDDTARHTAIIKRLNPEIDNLRQQIDSAETKITTQTTELFIYINSHRNDLVTYYTKVKNYNVARIGNNVDLKSYEDKNTIKAQAPVNVEFYIQQEEKSASSLKIPTLPTQTEMIDALAIYLAKRVKQEAVMYFFETIKARDGKYELVETFFPSTISLLQSKEVYDIPNLGIEWRYALSRDFLRMPANLINSPWLSKRIPENKKQYLPYLKSMVDMADLIFQRYSYYDIIKSMYLKYAETPDSKELAPIFSLLYAVNNELFTKRKDTSIYRMLGYEDFRRMNKEELEMMLSLLNLKYGECVTSMAPGIFSKLTGPNTFSNLTDKFELAIKDVEKVRIWLGSLEQGIAQIDKVRKDFILLQEKIDKSNKEDALFNTYSIWNFTVELINLTIPANFPGIDSAYQHKMKNVTKYLRTTQEIYGQLTNKNFAGAVNTAINLVDTLFYSETNYELGHLSLKDSLVTITLADKNTKNKYLETIFEKLKGKKDIIAISNLQFKYILQDTIAKIYFTKASTFAAAYFQQDRHSVVVLRKLAGFLNDVVRSHDSKTLAKVVESYALPAGSYKRKRNNWWSIDLNAYVGLYAGREWTEKVNGKRSAGGVYGISAPIGLTLSKTFGRKVKKELTGEYDKNPDMLKMNRRNINKRTKSTLSITASIIHIGAVVSYRFNNTADSVLPQTVHWRQIVSPGLHIAYGLAKTPLVVKTGLQFTPELRRINDEIFKERQLDTYRIYLGIYFDIPLFNLWERKTISYN